ncbi:hypothetical protein DSM100685_1829 [Bifidobacterium avesanii]|nr:hypothetical protein DSM100685_1829 [Bifidobacterium avesanii]
MTAEWITAIAALATVACGFGKLLFEILKWLTERQDRKPKSRPRHKG